MTGKTTTSQPNIGFSDIRPLEGKQDKGFEELCVQLLPWLVGDFLQGVIRVDGRGGDGGVEAIAQTVSNMHVGLQSKFFSKLDEVQFRQIDESVKTVTKKHPELTRYLVCVPLDRTPGQIEKWKTRLNSWHTLNPTLSIEWVGFSELFGHLLKPEASYLRAYWFSCPDFSMEWVSRQTEAAIEQLHNRYTPQLHQPTSAEVSLDFLTASEKARTDHRQLCSRQVVAWRRVLNRLPEEIEKLKSSVDYFALQQAHDVMMTNMQDGCLTKQGDSLITALKSLSEQAEHLVSHLFPQDERYSNDRNAYWGFRRNSELDKALELTEDVLEKVKRYVQAQQQTVWVLTGEAGSGKSHLMASLAKTVLAEGRACLLMVGERFSANDVLAQKIPGLLHWDGAMRELLACLSTQAAITENTALLMIDAINESLPRGLWRRELFQFMVLVQEFSGIRLLVSCRSDCLESAIPAGVLTDVNTIKHHGFDLQFHEVVKAYFDGYRVFSPQFPTLNAEFQNPLFLKTLCEAYQGKTLPLGPVSFVGVLTEWEKRIAGEIEKKIDCPQRATQRAIDEIVQALAISDVKRISADTAEDICFRHFSVAQASLALYRHMNSEGLLQEVEMQDGMYVRLQYERFSDVRIAQTVLKRFASKQQWLAYWNSCFLPNRVDDTGLSWEVESELFAYALLLPDAVTVELVECPIAAVIHDQWARTRAKDVLWSVWLDALPWRVFAPGDTKIAHLFVTWAGTRREQGNVFERLFQFACVPNHPLNADFLHRHLNKLELPARELGWTVSLAMENPTDQTSGSIVAPFLYWADAAVGKASDEQVRLIATVLLWLTSSPNRELRDRATDIAIRVLVAHRQPSAICMQLLEGFWGVNDPYVKERLLAVICGVLPHMDSVEAGQIADFVLCRFWQEGEVPPHILQREYVAFIVRHACEAGLLPPVNLDLLERHPYKPKPVVWTEAQVDVYAKNPDYSNISSSLVPEEMGHYGNFGRYVMGSAVHHFVDDERAEPTTRGLGRGGQEHDARFARRFIWQRVIELGWTPERFSVFERGLGYSGRSGSEKRIERISKKYQWIGLHEYLGHLSDSLLFREWIDPARPLRGAWELHARDYEPDSALDIQKNSDSNEEDAPPTWWIVENPVSTADSIQEKQDWVRSAFLPFKPYLSIDHDQRSWIVLYTHLNFEEEIGFGVERFTSAQMSQWIDVRAFLIQKSKLSRRLKVLQGTDFYGNGCDVPRVSQCWVSEFPWHPSFREADEDCKNNQTWVRSLRDEGLFFPVCEISNDSRRVLLPAPSLHRGMGSVLGHPLSAPRLTSSGLMEMYDSHGRCMVKGTARKGSVLMIDRSLLMKYLEKNDYSLVWAVLSEKSAWNGSEHVGGIALQSAIYVMDGNGGVSGGNTVRKVELPEE